ncbi:MAG: LPS export ABC transporter periplasmic protein LptC [Tannerella sp.]|nr:LPS export ABC transporter periplasmic protein LptC [Tannerella sp.]
MLRKPVILLLVAAALSGVLSCGSEKREQIEIAFNPDSTYTYKSTNVVSFISDSGTTRYKIIAQTWLMFGLAKEPYQFFPDGGYLEKFDSVFNVEASIRADTAYYYERQKLWRLDGNVDISNFEGERFQTSQMFIDDMKGIMYSDAYIKITRPDGFVENGIGFRSNRDVSEWEIYHAHDVDIPFEDKRRVPGDSIAVADSLQ